MNGRSLVELQDHGVRSRLGKAGLTRIEAVHFEAKRLGCSWKRTKIDWQVCLLGQGYLLSGQSNIPCWMWAVVHPQVLTGVEVGLRPPAGEPCLIMFGAVMLRLFPGAARSCLGWHPRGLENPASIFLPLSRGKYHFSNTSFSQSSCRPWRFFFYEQQGFDRDMLFKKKN